MVGFVLSYPKKKKKVKTSFSDIEFEIRFFLLFAAMSVLIENAIVWLLVCEPSCIKTLPLLPYHMQTPFLTDHDGFDFDWSNTIFFLSFEDDDYFNVEENVEFGDEIYY